MCFVTILSMGEGWVGQECTVYILMQWLETRMHKSGRLEYECVNSVNLKPVGIIEPY